MKISMLSPLFVLIFSAGIELNAVHVWVTNLTKSPINFKWTTTKSLGIASNGAIAIDAGNTGSATTGGTDIQLFSIDDKQYDAGSKGLAGKGKTGFSWAFEISSSSKPGYKYHYKVYNVDYHKVVLAGVAQALEVMGEVEETAAILQGDKQSAMYQNYLNEKLKKAPKPSSNWKDHIKLQIEGDL